MVQNTACNFMCCEGWKSQRVLEDINLSIINIYDFLLVFAEKPDNFLST